MSGHPTHRIIATGEPVYPDGYDPADLELLPDGYWEAAELERLKAEMRALVDSTAGAFRTTFLTYIPGQDEIYSQKAAEAASFTAAYDAGTATADVSTWPYLYHEAEQCLSEATVETMKARADIIMAAAAPASALLPVQEGIRVARKEAITAATTAAEVRDLGIVDWAALLG